MKKKGGNQFTHFGSIPFIRDIYRKQLHEVQQQILQLFQQKGLDKKLQINNPNLFHLTLMMLTLPHASTKNKVIQIMQSLQKQIQFNLQGLKFTTAQIKYFSYSNWKNPKANKTVSVIYLDVQKNNQFQRLQKLSDLLIRALLKQQILIAEDLKDMYIRFDHKKGMFIHEDVHITLFRCQYLEQNEQFKQIMNKCKQMFQGKELLCDYVDISTRGDYDPTYFYTPFYRIPLPPKNT